MHCRKHTPRDRSEIAELRWMLKTIEEPEVDHEQRERFIKDYTMQLRASDDAGDTVHWVAESESEAGLVGALTIRLVRKELSPGAEAGYLGYLTNVFVREESRDKGVGSQLLEHAIEWSRAQGLELLIVWPSERSYPFYRRAGSPDGMTRWFLDLSKKAAQDRSRTAFLFRCYGYRGGGPDALAIKTPQTGPLRPCRRRRTW